MVKAVALLSGGLDSTLAIKLILNQGIKVEALNFTSPFCLCGRGGCGAAVIAKKFKIPIKIINKGKEYLKVIRKPKHGYGKNMNPCIDCRIFMLKKAKAYAKKIKADFIFTGEVLGERPMSQYKRALLLIEKESSLKGKILRPLSAKLLPKTEAEKKGLVNREKLLAIKGRSRKPQITLAKKFKITDYPCPAGGCLLTYKEFSNKLRDLFKHKKIISLNDIELLKVGRHFRFGKAKIIVGRNKEENEKLTNLKQNRDICLEVIDYMGPTTLLIGDRTKKAIEKAASLTVRYSDAPKKEVRVKYDNKIIKAKPIKEKELLKLRI